MRESFGNALVEIGSKNEKIIVVDADLSKSTKTEYFKKVFPNRFVDVGIAEQNLMGVSGGLASTGKNVFASSFAVFETGRAYEIIRNMICMANLNVKICSTHAGIMTGPDGATHQSIEDISIMRVLPNMNVLVPADALEVSKMVEFLSTYSGTAYLRLVRNSVDNIHDENYKFEYGKAEVLSTGTDISIIACGPMVSVALKALDILKEYGISARIVNMSTIKPIDEDELIRCATQTKAIITVEDHSIIGGLGSAVSEFLSENNPTIIKKIGVDDVFGMSGQCQELYEYHGLTKENIVKVANDILNFM